MKGLIAKLDALMEHKWTGMNIIKQTSTRIPLKKRDRFALHHIGIIFRTCRKNWALPESIDSLNSTVLPK